MERNSLHMAKLRGLYQAILNTENNLRHAKELLKEAIDEVDNAV